MYLQRIERKLAVHYNPKAETRILLCAHWDSRPWADNDPDSTNWRKPVLAANDGASGVAVMLEIARQPLLDVSDDLEIDGGAVRLSEVLK